MENIREKYGYKMSMIMIFSMSLMIVYFVFKESINEKINIFEMLIICTIPNLLYLFKVEKKDILKVGFFLLIPVIIIIIGFFYVFYPIISTPINFN